MTLDWKYPLTNYVLRRVSVPIARRLAPLGVKPNPVTFSALFAGILAGASFATGRLALGLGLTALTLILDVVDGDLARITNRVSRAGDFLDSIEDRFVDGALLIGLILSDPSRLGIIGALLLAGTPLVSYVRSKAELAGVDCRVGIATRDFRLLAIIIAVALKFFVEAAIFYAFVTLTVLTYATVVHRGGYGYLKIREAERLMERASETP